MTSAKRHEAHSPARSGGVVVMDDPISAQITKEVAGWEGVSVEPHRFGGTEFRVGRRELGHLHGSRLADLPFPLLVRNELVDAGRAEPHHIYPESGWVSYFTQNETDIARVVALFRLNYERPWLESSRSSTSSPDAPQR